MEMGRNTQCWCGSGKKYKQCHEKFDEKYAKLAREKNIMPSRELIKMKKILSELRKAQKSIQEYWIMSQNIFMQG